MFVESKLADFLLPLLVAPPGPSTIPPSPKSDKANPDIPLAAEYTSSIEPNASALPPVKFASPDI